MTKHLITAATLAVAGALAAAVMVVWMPTIAGKVVVIAAVAAWLGIWLGKHRHAKRGLEAMTAGLAVALALVILEPRAVPLVVFLAMTAPTAGHYLNPRRARVVRTTRGVRTAGKAAGGRAGKPGEKTPARPRTATASRPRTPARPKADAALPPELAELLAQALAAGQAAPSGPPRWPLANPGWRPTDALPWAGEAGSSGPAPAAPPRRLRTDPNRPSRLHRSICVPCLDGDCELCKDRGCECPGTHPLRTPVAPDLDVPPF
jgi:hypothetical protein